MGSTSAIDGLSAALRRCAEIAPDAEAIVGLDGSRLRYAAWNSRADALAAALRDRVPAGSTVLAHLDESADPDFAVALFGAIRAGCFLLPMTTRFGPAEVAQAYASCDAALLVADETGRRRLDDPALGLPLALAIPASTTSGAEPVEAAEPIDPVTPGGAVVYTSGTTGVPRGVRCPHDDLVSWIGGWSGVPEHTPHLHQFPPDTVGALDACLRALRRYPAVRAPVFDAQAVAGLVETYRPVLVIVVPAAAAALAQTFGARLDAPACDAVERVFVSSALATDDTLGFLRRTFRRAIVTNLYSSTEAGRAQTWQEYPPLGDAAHEPVGAPVSASGLSPVGRPTPGTEVRVTGAGGEVLPTGSVGQIWLRTADPAGRAYLGASDAGSVFRDGWVRTGDLGLLDDDGTLHLAGRESDTINVGGINISAPQIEAVLTEHPDVAEAAVVPVTHHSTGQQVVAGVVLTADAGLAPEAVDAELGALVSGRLGPAKTPAVFVTLPALPRNRMGKVVKSALAETLAGHVAAAAPAPGALSSTEVTAAVDEVWRSVFGPLAAAAGLPPDADFFEIGGDSLEALQFTDALGRRLGREISPAEVFSSPTPDAFARSLLGTDDAGR